MTNRPVILNDPTGHCPGRKPGQKCATNPKAMNLPDWWLKRSHIFIEGYGYFDTGHIKRGWQDAKWFEEETHRTLDRGGGIFKNPAVSNGSDYEVYYSVSANLKNVSRDQKFGVLYGMYTDFERGYEEYQKDHLNPSAFSPEDLPSDHLGFWAYMNKLDMNEIPSLIISLGKVSTAPDSSLAIDSFGIPRNHEFSPMIPLTIRTGSASLTKLVNMPWPSWLEINTVLSGPDTWQRIDK